MRGRATPVVLPALVVLGLVAVVAIASTGSTPGGSGERRRPSGSLFDVFYSLGIVAAVLGGVILAYGLTQAKHMSWDEVRGHQRQRLLGFVAFLGIFTLVTYLRMRNWEAKPLEPEEEELVLPGELPPPTTSETGQTAPYEPGISWLTIALVVGLVLAAALAYVVAERRGRRGQRSMILAAELVAVLDETLDDLRAEADPRKAIIATYARLERVLAANGVPRGAAETSAEYLARILGDLELDAEAVVRLTRLYTQAKFSQHDVDTAMKEEAIGALEQVRDELRLAREKPVVRPDTPMRPVGAGS